MKQGIKKLLSWYFRISSSNRLGLNLNLAILRMLYKLPCMHSYIDRLTYLFQKNYKNMQPEPLIKKVNLKNGLCLCVDVVDRLGGLLYFYRNYSERRTQEFLNEQLQPGDTFVDVGANCGYYSLLAAQKLGPTGRVFAFEANPVVCNVFRQSIALNQLDSVITLENYAVADISGKVLNFYLPYDAVNSAIGTLVADGQMAITGNINTSQSINVLSVALDDYLANKQLAGRLFIKIDAEGAEELVLKGMQSMLLRKMPYCIIIESDGSDSSVCKYLGAHGYVLHSADVFGNVGQFGNYIFVKNI